MGCIELSILLSKLLNSRKNQTMESCGHEMDHLSLIINCNKYDKRVQLIANPLQKCECIDLDANTLRPFWRCLGNSQSGVQVVRKTALNYSERENFTQARGHCRPNICSAER